MTRIGIISNPASGQNKRRMAAVRQQIARHMAGTGAQDDHIELSDVADMPEALGDLARRGVEAVAINGGDGTVQAAMTSLLNDRPFGDPPPLAVIPGGMTNLIAAAVGHGGRPERALARLFARAAKGELETLERPVLTLAASASDPGVHGMFAGGGTFHDAVLWTRHKLHARGADRGMAVGLAIANLALRSLLGQAEGHPAFGSARMRLTCGDGTLLDEDVFLMLCTTLDRMMLGAMPFWQEDADVSAKPDKSAQVRVTTVAYPPRRLSRAIWPVLRGRPRPWMKSQGYRSRRIDSLGVVSDKPIVFDGEFFDAARLGLAPDAPMRLEHRHDLRFLR